MASSLRLTEAPEAIGPSSANIAMSEDTYAGTQWQGSSCKASTRRFRKWWPTTYPDSWLLPNGTRYSFVWKLRQV